MKWAKKNQNILFVEDEEVYSWVNAKNNINRKLIYISLLFVIVAILFSALR